MGQHDEQPTFKQRLSPGQYALMRAIASGDARHGMETLGILNYITFTSLIKREYVSLDGRHNPTFTEAGYRAFITYQEMEMPQRLHPGKVTKYVAELFNIAEAVNGSKRKKKKGK